MIKNRKPIVLLAATAAASTAVAVPALATGAGTGASATAAATTKPAVSDLDVDLVGGRTLDVTVEARRATSVKLTYAGTTRTARVDPDDADDRDKDYSARFTARTTDRAGGKRVAIKVTATGKGGTTTKVLHDRLDVEGDDD